MCRCMMRKVLEIAFSGIGGVIVALIATQVVLPNLQHREISNENVFAHAELTANRIIVFVANESSETIDFSEATVSIPQPDVNSLGSYIPVSKTYTFSDEIFLGKANEGSGSKTWKLSLHQSLASGTRDRFEIVFPGETSLSVEDVEIVLRDRSGVDIWVSLE